MGTNGMKYEDIKRSAPKAKHETVKHMLKEGRKERRDGRSVGSMTFWQLQGYAWVHKMLVPHKFAVAVIVLVGSNIVWFLTR